MKTIPILYSDDEIIIINKEAGLSVQGGKNITESVDSLLPQQIGQKVFLVHRLDKDTSGILVVAKSSQGASKWTKLFGSHIIKKQYIALCYGKMKKDEGIIETPIEVKGITKNARTFYKVLKTVKLDIDENTNIPLSLISLILDTGRMHQIRIHLAKNNCPILADDKHGDFKINKLVKKKLGIKTLQLAAIKLTIPLVEGEIVFEIDNPLYKI